MAAQSHTDIEVAHKGWLADAIEFASEEARTAKIVTAYAIITIVFSLINFAIMWNTQPAYVLRFMGLGAALVAGVPPLILLRKGYVHFAAHYLIGSTWIVLAASSWVNNGPGRPTFQWIYLALTNAALTLGIRWTLIYGIATFLLTILLYVAYINNWQPDIGPFTVAGTYFARMQQTAAWTSILVVTSGIFYEGLLHLQKNLKVTRQAEEDVRRLNAELQAANTELEERVQERTAALQQANDDLEIFAARVSHDMRAPLRSINGFSRILIEEEQGLSAESRSMLDRIAASSVQMGQMIDAVLRFARIGRAALHIHPVDLERLVQDSMDLFLASYDRSRVVVHLGELPTVEGDPVLLRQAIDNLVGNALKYSAPREKSEIWISAESDEEYVRIQIHDNGVGFQDGDPNKLFEPFARSHGREFEGVGLGLATVKRIVELHGGSVRAMHSDLGSAAFEITLPIHLKSHVAVAG